MQPIRPKGRKSKVDPSVLFQVIAYAYQCGIYSSRKIEEACRYRIDFLWLLDGQKAPDHATCQGRDAIDQKCRTEFDPNADLKNAGMFTADYGSAGSLAGGAA